VLGEAHPDTLTAMGTLAGTLWAQGDVAARAVLDAERRVLGAERPDTLRAMSNLAQMLEAQGVLGRYLAETHDRAWTNTCLSGDVNGYRDAPKQA